MPTTPTEAASQLSRLLLALPALEGGEPHPIADIAQMLGVSVEIVARDLRTLVTRVGDEPLGFVERIQLGFAADSIQVHSNPVKRPMALSASEVGAIELGLDIIARELAPEDASFVEQVRRRVRQVAVVMPVRKHGAKAGKRGDGDVAARSVSLEAAQTVPEHLSSVRDAATRRRKARIRYRAADATKATERTVRPYGLVYTGGRWFLVAFCELREDLRIFRVDRISKVAILDDQESVIPDAFSLDTVMAHGRALVNGASESLRVRYAPKISRWVAENETGTVDADGWFVVDHPLLDDRWAVRHVLQYGTEAEVVAPDRIRKAVVERLGAIATGKR